MVNVTKSHNCSLATIEVELFRQSIDPVVIPCLLLVCAFAMIANCTVLIVIQRISPSKVSDALLLTKSLTIADLIAVVLYVPTLLMWSRDPAIRDSWLIEQLFNPPTKFTIHTVYKAALITEVLHLVALSAFHYVLVEHPHQLKGKRTRLKNTRRMLVAVWTLPLPLIVLMHIPIVIVIGVDFGQRIAYRLAIQTCVTVPMLITAVLYGRILNRLWNRGTQNLGGNERRRGRNVRSVKTTILLVGTFVIGWLPMAIVYVLRYWDRKCATPWMLAGFEINDPGRVEGRRFGRIAGSASLVAATLNVLKFLANPVIFALRIPEIQNELRRLIARRQS